jgi:uncharacterized protein
MISFNEYILKTFKKRVWRLPLSTGYPCPNRLNGKSGCTYCSEKSFLPRYLKEKDSLENQIKRGIEFFGKRYKVDTFYGYFQENTGTYGERSDLLTKYERVLSNPKLIGLIISTRPDFIDEEMILKLSELNKNHKKDIWIELGLQSIYEKTLERINRGHSYKEFQSSVSIIKKFSDFKITVHLIIGLPGENPEMIKIGINKLFSENKIDGIKFRLLEVIKDTPIEKDYLKNKKDYFIFDIDSYAKLLASILENIPKETVVMRLANFKSLELLNKTSDKKLSKNELLAEINKYLKL